MEDGDEASVVLKAKTEISPRSSSVGSIRSPVTISATAGSKMPAPTPEDLSNVSRLVGARRVAGRNRRRQDLKPSVSISHLRPLTLVMDQKLVLRSVGSSANTSAKFDKDPVLHSGTARRLLRGITKVSGVRCWCWVRLEFDEIPPPSTRHPAPSTRTFD
jgi:hypothetical protein